MTPTVPTPEEYLVDYSPLRPAQLTLRVADDRPGWGPRDVARRVRDTLSALRGDQNDRRAEKAWRAMDWAVTLDGVCDYLTALWRDDPLREFEYPFLARALHHREVTPRVIVDLGGGFSYSTVVPLLFHFPGADIVSVDVMHHRHTSKYGVRYVQGDCMHAPLPDGGADVVALISTLEHVGLGRYGDPLDVDGDRKAMAEAHRLLKPGGHVILTVPYGYPTVVFNRHRIYDDGRFALVTAGFTPVQLAYTLHHHPATREACDAEFVHKSPDITGGIMALLRAV